MWLLKVGREKKELALQSWRYQERCEDERAQFLKALEKIAVCDRVDVDEAGVDDTLSYAYGWSEKGTRCLGERLGHRTQRVSTALNGSRWQRRYVRVK